MLNPPTGMVALVRDVPSIRAVRPLGRGTAHATAENSASEANAANGNDRESAVAVNVFTLQTKHALWARAK
jgi:hypothetical protein